MKCLYNIASSTASQRLETELINDNSSWSPHSSVSTSSVPDLISDPRAFISKLIMENEREGNNKGRGA